MTKQERVIHLALTVNRLRRALQKIADLPVEDHKRDSRKAPPRLRARRIAVAALKAEA